MFNRKKISHSVDEKASNNKKRELSTWINDFEIQAYATEEMKQEIKDLLLEVYNSDKDIRDQFFKKYITAFSEIINEKSVLKDIDCIYKGDASFDIPEKSEFQMFIENRNNKLLEKENSKNKNHKNYWSEDKKIKNNFYNLDDYDDKNKNIYNRKNNKRNKDKKDYISEQKRNNSKIRDYAKNRYQMMTKYESIFVDDDKKNNNKNNIRLNKNKKMKNPYIFYKNIGVGKINFRKSNINKNNDNKNSYYQNNHEYNIPRLLILNHKNNNKDKKEIKIYSINNIKPKKDLEINTSNNYYNNKKINNRYNTDNNSKNTSDIKIEKEFLLDSRLNNLQNIKKENLNNFYSKYEEIRKNENLDESFPSFQKFSDEFTEENEDEIKKINISGVNYKISGYGPKKVEINEEIILDNNNTKNKTNKEKEPNKQTKTNHKKIIIKKDIDNNDEDKNLTQKIEKDVTTSKTRIRNIKIPNEAFINLDKGKNLKEIFNYTGKDKNNNYYEISYVKEDEVFGIDPNLFNNIPQIKSQKEDKNNAKTKVSNSYDTYNIIRNKKPINFYTSEEKFNYLDENNINNKENKNNENNIKYKMNEVKKNIYVYHNNVNKNKDIKEQTKETRSNWRENKYNNFNKISNVNRSNGMKNEDIIKEKKINNLNNLEKNKYKEKYNSGLNNNNIEQLKTNDINFNTIKDSQKGNINGKKRKRFHRIINSGL